MNYQESKAMVNRWYAIDTDSIRDYLDNISPAIAVYYASNDGYVVEYGGLKPSLLPKNNQFKLSRPQIKLVRRTLHLEGRSDKVEFVNINHFDLNRKKVLSHAKAEK